MSSGATLHVDLPSGSRSIHVDPGAPSIADLLRDAGIPLNTRCGQRGICDGCNIELLSGSLISIASQSVVQPSDTTVPACQHRIARDEVRIRVPQRSLLSHQPHILTDFRINVPSAQDPIWQAPASGGPAVPLGIAVDIGTTTVAAILVELNTSRILARACRFNQQMRFGDDVLTRITLCQQDPSMVRQLQDAITLDTIRPIIDELLATAVAKPAQVVCTTIAGNTTMLHLLAGVDPTPLGVVPFTPAFLDHRVLSCGDIPNWPSDGVACDWHLLPGAAAYIGADLTAGCFATGLIYDPGPSLLVDVGTNGEIILKHGEHLLGCSTAAGPAFEGAKLTSGMRAARGAMSHLHLAGAPPYVSMDVIGGPGTPPAGLCGSACIDFLAEARRLGWLTTSGRLIAHDGPIPIRKTDRGMAFLLASDEPPVQITESDIASLLTAKAAIAAGIETLLHRAGLQASDIRKLYLAGGFGTHMNAHSAIACGLLPGFTFEQIETVGNSSLAGAYLALIDRSALAEIGHLAGRLEVVELNLDPQFECRYVEHLSLI